MPILNINDSSALALYNDFVETSPWGTFFQSPSWALVKENWHADFVYLEDPNNPSSIRAALSILSISNDGEHHFLYAPRGPVCDPADIDTVRELVKEAEPIVRKRKAFLLRFDPAIQYDANLVQRYKADPQFVLRSRTIAHKAGERVFSNPRHNMVLAINGRNFDEIMATYPGKVRYDIRRTYKKGLRTRFVKFSDEMFSDAVDRFYRLTVEMAERKQITHRPKDYFYRLLKAFPDHANIVETHDETGEVLSSCIVITFNRTAMYIYAATSNNKRPLRANTQTVVEAIGQACKKGMANFDLGGVYGFDMSDGLYAYKVKYTGAEGLQEFIGEIDVVYDEELYRDFI